MTILSSLTTKHRDATHSASLVLAFGLLALLVACGSGRNDEQAALVEAGVSAATSSAGAADQPVTATPDIPEVELTIAEEDVVVDPLPLRAGFPFTVSAEIHNTGLVPADDVPVFFYLSAEQDVIGHTSYWQVLTVTLPVSSSLSVDLPIDWNFAGGDHRLWVQVNRVPEAWQSRIPTLPETDTGDNHVLMELMVDPFDAYTSDLCSGRTDVEIGPTDILPEPGQQRVLVRVHNVGNSAVYNLPVIVMGDDLAGIAYTPAIPPCGGTADVYVEVGRPFDQGEPLTVQVNPTGWQEGMPEENQDNNVVAVTAGLAPGLTLPVSESPDDYDFSIAASDIEIPEMWIVLVTVRNQGTRDASMVPIRVENAGGRTINDAIPLVQGNGAGIAAIKVGYLWLPGGELTFTINPEDAKDAYPETNRTDNVTVFTLP